MKKIAILFLAIATACLCTQVLATIEITNPGKYAKFQSNLSVEGNISPAKNTSLGNVYVLVRNVNGQNPWSVFKTTLYPNWSWKAHVFFGSLPPEEIGSLYGIVAIETNETLEEGWAREIPRNNAQSEVRRVIRTIVEH